MSLKLAIAKLSAAAAGVALLQGGAVRVAEPMNTAAPDYSTNIDGTLIAVDPETGARYIKGATRIIPEQRRRRIVERTIECAPVAPGGPSMSAGVVQTYVDPNECPPLAQVAYMPAPLPPLPPVSGGGGFGGSGGFGGYGGGGGFGGGFFGGFFGGGGSSSGDVSVVSTTTTTGGTSGTTSGSSTSTSGSSSSGGSSGVVIDINIDNSTSTTSSSGQISSSTGQVSTSSSTGQVSSSSGAVSSTSTSGHVSSSTGAVSTHSRTAMGALSLLRGPSLMIRV
jgi:hypothetical protein